MDLLAIDLEDADDVQAKIDTKADRKRRAFLESKASYPTEPIVLQRAWFQPLADRAHLGDDRKPVDLTVQHLYLKRNYQKALDLCVEVIDDVLNADAGSRTGTRAREFVDTALRCCMKLGHREQAYHLVEKYRQQWAAGSGGAATAGQAYLASGHPKEAISAFMIALRDTTQQLPYLESLASAFSAWQTSLPESDPSKEAISQISNLLQLAVTRTRRHNTFPDDLFSDNRETPAPSQLEPPPPTIPVSADTVREWLQALDLSDSERDKLHALCMYGAGGANAAFDADAGGPEVDRSVRNL